MADFPYTSVTGKLRAFFEKIQMVGKPDNVDVKWLASVGFTATNDRTIVPILKFVGFVDQAGAPTDKWMTYRDKSRAAKVLAQAIREGYAELFRLYPDACRRSDDELKAFFTTKTKGAAQVVAKTVATFKTLCGLADFSDAAAPVVAPSQTPPTSDATSAGLPAKTLQSLGANVAVIVNIQLTLPETADETVYDKLFAAMKKHLLP